MLREDKNKGERSSTVELPVIKEQEIGIKINSLRKQKTIIERRRKRGGRRGGGGEGPM